MNTRLSFGMLLLIISTLSYNIPSYIINLNGYDFSKVPEQFYAFYCLFIACNLFLVSVYALYLFILTDVKFYKSKILFCWLFLAETLTFLDHVFRKYLISAHQSNMQMVITLIIFAICCLWFLRRALHAYKSEKFYPERTYIVKFKPANIFGIFNHIANLHGHAAIYQDGILYKFKKSEGRVVEVYSDNRFMKQLISHGKASVREIPYNGIIQNTVGKKYHLLKYNCNHLIKEAKGEI